MQGQRCSRPIGLGTSSVQSPSVISAIAAANTANLATHSMSPEFFHAVDTGRA